MSIAARLFDLGELVSLIGQFQNRAGGYIDPSTVKFKLKNPAGVVVADYTYGTDSQLQRDSMGKYRVNVDANAVGWWYYRFYSTGSGQAAAERSFRVNSSNFGS